MNVANESLPAPSLRRLPFLIRLAPQFVNRISAAASANPTPLGTEIDGLLFGVLENDFAVIQSFRDFPALASTAGEEAGESPQRKQFDDITAAATDDPELVGLAVLGWFSTRTEGGLQATDVEFHEKLFRNPNDVALIVKPEPPEDVSLELYSRTPAGVLSNEGHRWGSVRLSIALPVLAPVEVPMRAKIHDDFYMRAYQADDSSESEEPVGRWKGAIASTTKRAFELLKSTRSDDRAEGFSQVKEAGKAILEGPRSMIQALRSGFQSSEGSPHFPASPASTPAKFSAPPAPRSTAAMSSPVIPNAAAQVHVGTPQVQPIDTSQPKSRAAGAAAGYGGTAAAAKLRPASPPALEPPKSVEPTLTRSPVVHGAPLESPTQALTTQRPRELAAQPESHPKAPGASLIPQNPALARYLARPRELPWLAMAVVFTLTAIVTFGFISISGAGQNGTLPGFLQTFWPAQKLDLRIHNEGDRVQLSWNENGPTVRSAQDALLEITDGQDRRQVLLTAREVANGSVLYRPNTDDVVFRLEVHAVNGRTLSESMRVLGTSKAPILDVSQPRSEPQSTATAKLPPPSGKATPPMSSRLQLDSKSSFDPARLRPVRPKVANAEPRTPTAAPPIQQPANDATPQKAADQAVTPQAAVADATRTSDLGAAPVSQPPAAPNNNAIEAENKVMNTPPAETQKATIRESQPPPAVSTPTQAVQQPRTEEPSVAKPAALETQTQPSSGVQTPAIDTEATSVFQPPRPIRQVVPNVKALLPGVADATGEVKVQVKVDQKGHVVEAHVVEGNKRINSVIKNVAVIAAKQWTFVPASLHGKNIESDHTILFQFHK